MKPKKQRLPKWTYKFNWHKIHKYAEMYSLPPYLIAAVIQTESGGNIHAIRHEPGYRWTWRVQEFAQDFGLTPNTIEVCQKMSWGPMQIMYAVALEEGFRGYPSELCSWDEGLKWACKHLRDKRTTYGPEPAKTYAAYNAGSVRYTPGRLFVNQRNVDHFMKNYNELVDAGFEK